MPIPLILSDNVLLEARLTGEGIRKQLPEGRGNYKPDGILRRLGDVGHQARSRDQGLGSVDRRSRRHARPARFAMFFGTGVFPLDALFLQLVERIDHL